ncbi:CD5 antigen-like [Sebastes fasciatus]|uniref:CD5 antigen-like n=1 Tax=Sebastes fasciatus TaxID=394691 RepID=UPI003D9DBA4A
MELHNVRLVGGSSRCAGELEIKQQGEWRPVDDRMFDWNLKTAYEVCRKLDCGSAVSTGRRRGDRYKQSVRLVNGKSLCSGRLEVKSNQSNQSWSSSLMTSGSRDDSYHPHAWMISSSCGLSESSIRECVSIRPDSSSKSLEVTCSDSVRLVNGKSLFSGRLEVKSNQSNQSWSSVCEDDFDLQDAEVVCRELGCGAPSVLQGALYGDVEAPVWTKEFQCGGHESALLDCDSSDSDRNTCSPGKAVGLTCSEPDDVRLLGGSSRCDGTLEMKQHGEWRPVADRDSEWDQDRAAAVCNQLDCGSAVSTNISTSSSEKSVWWIQSSCVESHLMLRECLDLPSYRRSSDILEVICSDFLTQPNISFATFIDGVSEANQQGIQVLMGSSFTISCSILPQYPGGSFQLILTTSATSQNHTLPAVNHSAHFLFSAAEPAHRGEYRCVYHLYVFSYNFSSESQPLHLTVSASVTDLIIRLVVLLVLMVLMVGSNAAVYCYCKAPRGQKPRREDNMELDHLGGAGDLLGEEAGAQGTE